MTTIATLIEDTDWKVNSRVNYGDITNRLSAVEGPFLSYKLQSWNVVTLKFKLVALPFHTYNVQLNFGPAPTIITIQNHIRIYIICL